MTAYTDAAIPGEPGSISINDLLEFRDRRAGGYGYVHFNFDLVHCDACDGVAGLVYRNAAGGLTRIDDVEMAIRAHYIREGYQLRSNEISANRGGMRRLADYHEGIAPDDWMGVCEERGCSCSQSEEDTPNV